MSATPLVTVVIPTRNRPAFLRDCLAALQRSTLAGFEVHVMDQSDGDETRAVVEASHDPRLVYRRMPRSGACPARNLGAATARAEIVAFLDDDCEPTSTWLEHAVRHFDADLRLQFIFGNLRPVPCDPAAGEVPECLPGERLGPRPGVRAVMRHCSGGNMIVRKGLLRRIGGFDEMLGPANPWVRCNDVSIAYKVVRSGLPWLAANDTDVMHAHGFRPHAALVQVHESAMFGAGVHWGRALRRRQWSAGWHFAAAEAEILARPLAQLVRRQRPRGLRSALMHARGAVAGLRLPASVGLVDGAEFRRIERTGELDSAAASPAAGAEVSMPGAASNWS